MSQPAFYMLLPLTGPLQAMPLPPVSTLSPAFLASVAAAATDGTAVQMVQRIELNLTAHLEISEEKRADFRRVIRYLKVCCP